MMIEQFIDRLQQQGLLDKEIVEDLQRRVAARKGKRSLPKRLRNISSIKDISRVSRRPDS